MASNTGDREQDPLWSYSIMLSLQDEAISDICCFFLVTSSKLAPLSLTFMQSMQFEEAKRGFGDGLCSVTHGGAVKICPVVQCFLHPLLKLFQVPARIPSFVS